MDSPQAASWLAALAVIACAALIDVDGMAKPALPAFAGAQGYGAKAAGGRGGRIIAVTTLNDGGPGSLRACIDARGPRMCIFRVGGTIRFTQRPPVISEPFITIAGQTAPWPGITLTHAGGRLGFTPLLIKNSHDVIVRHIRVRTDMRGEARGANDAITFENSRNLVLDHISGSWALDEIINGQGDNDNVTISWSIFAEGIPRHDKCALLGSDPTKAQRMSFIFNICAHNGDRNPDLNFTPGSCIDVINNLFYDAGSQFAEIWESYGGTSANIVANIFRAGPSTSHKAIGIDRQMIASRGQARIYQRDNLFDGRFNAIAPATRAILTKSPVCAMSIKPTAPVLAYRLLLAQAGAFPRDAVDQRIVTEVRTRTGHIRRQPGTIAATRAQSPPPDSDGDGMPDDWERRSGSRPLIADPWRDADGDGVANLDEYLDHAHQQAMAG